MGTPLRPAEKMKYLLALTLLSTLRGEGDFLLSWVGFSEGRELLPWCCQVELAVLLGKLNRLLNNSLQLVIITNLVISSEREIFPQRVSLESVVGEDPPEVGMVGEKHAVHVPDLTLIPVRGGKHS